MSRKNAFLFTLLLTTSTTHTLGWLDFQPGTIAKCEVLATVALMVSSIRFLEETYATKKNTHKSWSNAFKDPKVHVGISAAAFSFLLGSWTFNDACTRLGIRF